MTREQILARIAAVLGQARGSDAPVDQLMNGTITILSALYGARSAQMQAFLKRREDVTKSFGGFLARDPIAEAVVGVLQNASEEIEAGLLSSLEQQITSDVLSDFLQLARQALNDPSDGAKNVAAVLAAAAYEDAIRRIAREHAGAIGRDKLDAVIGKLKDEGLLIAPQLGIAISYLSFRNHALHAEWDKIDRSAVNSVLGFVEQLLLKHFG